MGPGNMWRFPYRAAEGGGAAFVVLYLGMTFLIGVPMMMSEFAVGRRTGLSSLGALRRTGGRAWLPLGYLFVLTSLLIVSYLSVIAGWAVRYLVDGLVAGFPADPGPRFGVVATGLPAVLFHGLAMAVATGIVVVGVKGGIERASRILMPLLFVILVILAVWAATLDGAGPGYAFYLAPAPAAILDPAVLQAAASQAFFSLSVGMGIMLTYGSYLSGDENLGRDAVIVSLADLSVAFLAGLVVFPVIFALGLSGDVTESTIGALFISLPGAFVEMGLVGRVMGVGFFVGLTVAALTSMVSLLEVVASVGIDEFGLERRSATLGVGALAALIGVSAALSQDALGILDKAAGEAFVVLGVLGTALLVGWRLKDLVVELRKGASPLMARLVGGVVPWVRWVLVPVLAFITWVAFRDTWRMLFG